MVAVITAKTSVHMTEAGTTKTCTLAKLMAHSHQVLLMFLAKQANGKTDKWEIYSPH